MRLTPLAITDSYKLSHADQYPEGTTFVYSNFTPRKGRDLRVPEVVLFGLQAFLIELTARFNRDFFELSELVAVRDFENFQESVRPLVFLIRSVLLNGTVSELQSRFPRNGSARK